MSWLGLNERGSLSLRAISDKLNIDDVVHKIRVRIIYNGRLLDYYYGRISEHNNSAPMALKIP